MASLPRLAQVVCATPEPLSLAALYEAIGAEVDTSGDALIIDIDGSRIEYRSDAQSSGIVTIGVEVDDLTRRLAETEAHDISVTPIGANVDGPDEIRIGAEHANGVGVVVRQASNISDDVGAGTPIRLDHVALAVRDLDAAARVWAALTGVRPHMMGVHPVSNGAFTAARLSLGEQMIELVSPVEGHDSPFARRLHSKGEGPGAMALPVDDLDATIGRLAAIGVDVLRPAPHVMLHPRDTGGVLVQLTPRVQH
jgi:methylmalonyl-CoA/ethylmalonyl-CoA epimerase